MNRMNRMNPVKAIVTALVSMSLALAACEAKKVEPPPPAPPPATAAPAEAPVDLTDDDLPVPADFEEQAAAEITAANYKAELGKLEAEPN